VHLEFTAAVIRNSEMCRNQALLDRYHQFAGGEIGNPVKHLNMQKDANCGRLHP